MVFWKWRNRYLLKTDADGNEQWSKTFGGENSDLHGEFTAPTTDGGFIIVVIHNLLEMEVQMFIY